MRAEAEELLGQLDPEQREVATRIGVPLCVRAGAGTGKTRAITYRIAYAVRSGIYDPSAVMALTFTSRAAGELKSRLRDLGVPSVNASTFHSAALRQLKYFWSTAIGGPFPTLRESKMGLMSTAVHQLGMPNDKVSLRDLTAEVEWSRVSLVPADQYVARALADGRSEVAGCSFEDIARLIRVYEDVKVEQRVIDFEDVLILMIGILIDRPDVAKVVRDRYRHFVVDEYQDVSPLQHRLLQLWMGASKDLCVVGDVSQTIYSFAGASSSYLAHFAQEYGGASVVELVRDYRSSPQIVACANEVISSDTSEGAVRLVSQKPSSFPVAFKEYLDDADEAANIAGEILALRDQGVPLDDMAILYRTNAQSAEFENALAHAGIPYAMKGSEKFFERAEVRAAMIAMRSIARNGGTGSLVSDVTAVLQQAGWRKEAPAGAGAARERWSNLSALLKLASEMEENRPNVSMAEFVRELEERAEVRNAPSTGAVTLASLHAAKGLEWEAVFLAGMSEGLMPISHAKTEENREEERRLLYVGITRARSNLQISYAKGNGQRAQRKVSRFLDDVWPSRGRSSAPRKRSKSELEQEFAAEHPEDVQLYEALVQWRLDVSRSIEKPAYVVFPDTTLRAIAVAKPTTLMNLGRIKGVGSTKLSTWGEQVLDVVSGFVRA